MEFPHGKSEQSNTLILLMTSPIATNPDQRSTHPDGTSRRGAQGMRMSTWLPHLAISVLLVVLFLYRGSVPTGQLDLTVQWLLVAVVVVSAWICSPRVATTGCLVALATWSWMEIQTPHWMEWLPGQLVRLVVAMGLLAWLLRLREQLTAAKQLARVDGLTGLPNRQALIEALEAELSRAKRFGRPFSLALLDCDGFKQINDLRGHLAGDEVLRRIGESLRQNTRPFDCAGRWGGDEFLIVMSEVDCDV